MSAGITFSIVLPPGFRPDNILAFHRRDARQTAERVTGRALHKGLMWAGAPARLTIDFHIDRADATLAIEGRRRTDDEAAFGAMVRRMLGLTQDIAGFERHFAGHPELGMLIAARPGLRVPVAATPFEALTWAITGQQISLAAAVTLRRKLILATARPLADGLLCYPQARQLAGLTEHTLREAGFSTAKARTLLTLSRAVADDELPLDAWLGDVPVDEIRARLLAVRGIGPWTVDYTLLRGFGWLDGSLHGDAAVRRGLQALLGSPERIGETRTQQWLTPFSPWRALVAAHLWASQSATPY